MYFNYKIFQDWRETGERDVEIKYDIQAHPLLILTDSIVGSNDLIRVGFQTASDITSKNLQIQFTDPPQYKLSCFHNSKVWVTFTPPSVTSRVWNITKTATSLAIVCNEMQIIDYVFSDQEAGDTNGCVLKWSGYITRIMFQSKAGGTGK